MGLYLPGSVHGESRGLAVMQRRGTSTGPSGSMGAPGTAAADGVRPPSPRAAAVAAPRDRYGRGDADEPHGGDCGGTA